jgi:asparagine synthase (glutamine-hydrolysing)
MCGIVGALARPGRFTQSSIERAAASLAHRGPDDMGIARISVADDWELWLGHRRLSILDLSPGGHQPMTRATRDGRKGVLIYNGELYNHRALREVLRPSFDFTSSSDTEVLLAGLLLEGPKFFARTNAMLAAAFYDESARTLTLARDRLGKKPLFVYEGQDLWLFASELKAFAALDVPLTEDPRAWAYYHWLGHVPGERSIYRECRKLPAASSLEIRIGERAGPPILYWDPLAACASRFDGSYEDAQVELAGLLDDATRLRLDADVPVGVFLSAGIDSSLVASSVARHGSRCTAFIVKAADPELDESERAARTASQLGLPYEVLDLSLDAYHRQIEKVPLHYDEPCATRSQIAVMAISEAARKHVTVVLTGDGGDEVFCGYPWLGYPDRLFRYRAPLDLFPALRRAAKRALPTKAGERALRAAVKLLGYNEENLAVKKRIAQALLDAESPAELYDFFQELEPRALLRGRDAALLGPAGILARAKESYPGYAWDAAHARSVPELLAALELVTAMRDGILVKVDRGTMAYSLEARSPILDYRVVELGFLLPLEHKIEGGVYKRILRDLCAARVDRALAERRKSGWGIPLPPGLPPGSSIDVSWNRAVEQGWRARWRASESAAAQAAMD